jgi:hypothetical protein
MIFTDLFIKLKIFLRSTSAIFVCQLWKTPYVSQANRISDAGQRKLQSTVPMSAISAARSHLKADVSFSAKLLM